MRNLVGMQLHESKSAVEQLSLFTSTLSQLQDSRMAPFDDMCITKNDFIDALLTINDALAQTWILDSGASFHETPIKECFSNFTAGSHGHVYLWKQSCVFC